jgi:STE24 endopeptidase
MVFDSAIEVGGGLLRLPLSPDEILAVIAHELGHWAHRHMLLKYLVWEGVLLGVVVATYLLRNYRPLYAAFGYNPPDARFNAPSIIIRYLLVRFLTNIVLSGIISPAMNFLSMRLEPQADAFAARLGYSEALCSALAKLTPPEVPMVMDPLFALTYSSHPSLLERAVAMGC